MKTLLLIALATTLLWSPTLKAQDKPCVAQVYGDFTKELDWHCPVPNEDTMVPRLEMSKESVALERGVSAPFSGVLLDQNRVLTLGLRITGLRRLLWLELKAAKAEEDLRVARAREVAQMDAQSAEVQNQALTARNVQLEASLEAEKAWYRSWTFGFVLGAAITTTAAVSLAVTVR